LIYGTRYYFTRGWDASVAAINYDKEVDQYAREQGLLVIRVSSDDIFSIDSFDAAKLRRF
jgi:hypothetical protein